MKTSEMNARQLKAYYNVKHASNDLIGGLENALLDNEVDSDAYRRANGLLNNHDELVKYVYEMATTAIYGDGYCCFDDRATQLYLREINFCGKDWIMERCEKRITKLGY